MRGPWVASRPHVIVIQHLRGLEPTVFLKIDYLLSFCTTHSEAILLIHALDQSGIFHLSSIHLHDFSLGTMSLRELKLMVSYF